MSEWASLVDNGAGLAKKTLARVIGGARKGTHLTKCSFANIRKTLQCCQYCMSPSDTPKEKKPDTAVSLENNNVEAKVSEFKQSFSMFLHQLE